MEGEKNCPLFRQPEILSFAKGIGYCDLDNGSTACEGNVKFCDKPDACPEAVLGRRNSRNAPKSKILVFQLESSGQRIP
jgi:hypothetical protein